MLEKSVNDKALLLKKDTRELSEFYDKYAPACYGAILRIVSHEEISNRILARVFVDAFNNKINVPEYLTPFSCVLNHSRKKSISTLKAIKIFQECNNAIKTISSK